MADLFDLEHARKVLTAFGRAFGRLPENMTDTTSEQKDFVKQSVADLAEDSKVICVRLALFSEMMKGKSWTPTTLKGVGGTTGVGVTFLEETFSASTAPPEHRYHQQAARAVLRALLPNTGTDIKGEMKSRDELLAATPLPAEGAASQDEGTEKKDDSDSTEPAKDVARPELPPEPLLDREVTFEELIAFSPAYAGFMQQFKALPADAGFGPDWYDSVSFCRWLSRQSGLSESDQPYADPESLGKEEYPREPNQKANRAPRNWPLELGRRGFRLPTESEWETASRAGSRTVYGYGSDVALLGRFGWFQENSGKQVHPPRELRPTVRGAFDLHGNLLEWTHDWYGAFGESAVTDPLGAKEGSYRVTRGGCWNGDAADCRAASRDTRDPTYRPLSRGFRLALSSPSGVSSPAEQVQGK